jgi:hypothetical protein
MFDNVINTEVVNNLDDETVKELLTILEKAGY